MAIPSDVSPEVNIEVSDFAQLTEAVRFAAVAAEEQGFAAFPTNFSPEMAGMIRGFAKKAILDEHKLKTLPVTRKYILSKSDRPEKKFADAETEFPGIIENLTSGLSVGVEQACPPKRFMTKPMLTCNGQSPNYKIDEYHVDPSQLLAVVVTPDPFELYVRHPKFNGQPKKEDQKVFGPSIVGIRGPGSIFNLKRRGFMHGFGNPSNNWRFSIAAGMLVGYNAHPV